MQALNVDAPAFEGTALPACISAQITRWVFPPSRQGMPAVSYPFVFERWPITRDVPWVNLLLFGVATLLLAAGLRRAFAPGRLRWRRRARVQGARSA